MNALFTVAEIVPNVFAVAEPRLRSITLRCDLPGYGVESITLNAVHAEGAPNLGDKLVFELTPQQPELPAVQDPAVQDPA
jgi:hypothetical protein